MNSGGLMIMCKCVACICFVQMIDTLFFLLIVPVSVILHPEFSFSWCFIITAFSTFVS